MEQIKELVSEKFDGVELAELYELKEGLFNSAYFLKGNGVFQNGAVLKIGPSPNTYTLTYEQEIMKAEIEVYNLLKNKNIPVPTILASDTSKEKYPFDYFFMSFMEGKTWRTSRKAVKENRDKLMHELGRYNAVVHSIQGEYFGYIKEAPRFRHKTWDKAFIGMIEDILNDGKHLGCKLPYDQILMTVKEYRDVLAEVLEPTLVIYDMWAGNIFISENNVNTSITGFIDFERAFWGDPLADFTSATMIFDDVEQEREFIKGYEEQQQRPLSIGKSERIRMNLYKLYLALIIHIETYRYPMLIAKAIQSNSRKTITKLLNVIM